MNKKFNLSANFNKERVNYNSKNLLILLMKNTNGDVTKTDLLGVASSFFYHGYKDNMFISQCKHNNKVFNELVSEGTIIYEKRKPLKLIL